MFSPTLRRWLQGEFINAPGGENGVIGFGGNCGNIKNQKYPKLSPAEAKGPSSSKASPEADEVDFDANQVYAEVAPKTPTRGRWSLTNMVTSVVSSVVSVGRRLSGAAVSVPERKSMSPPPVKPAPVAEPEAAEETVPTEVEIKKPARRGRKSVIPELPKQMEPVAPQEIAEEAALAPPPRRGRKSVVPAVVEEQAKKEKASRKRKSVMHEPVVEEVEVEVPRARRAKKAPSPGGTAPKSPHVTIGETDKTHFITPRQKNDWRTGADTEDEEDEDEDGYLRSHGVRWQACEDSILPTCK